MNAADVYDPLPLTALVVVNTDGFVQFASFGPNSRKVIVPVGLNPPASVAVSETEPPIVMFADASVEIVGLSLMVVSVSPVVAALAGDRVVVGIAAVRGDPLERAHGARRERDGTVRPVAVDGDGAAGECRSCPRSSGRSGRTRGM